MKIGNRTPTAILTSDWHLRDDQPIARTDDYFKAMSKKVQFIRELQAKYNCLVLHAGDLFHKAKSSPFLEAWALKNLPDKFISCAGQHDLLNHRLDKYYESSIGVIEAAGKLYQYTGLVDLYDYEDDNPNANTSPVVVIHTFVQKPDDSQDKLIGGYSASKLLRKFSKAQLILTGDNHKQFIYAKQFTNNSSEHLLVNPGSLMRMTASQEHHTPKIYLWYREDNSIEEVILPHSSGVLSREHIDLIQKRDERMDKFVNKMSTDYDVGVSFEENIKQYINTNNLRQSIADILWECLGE